MDYGALFVSTFCSTLLQKIFFKLALIFSFFFFLFFGGVGAGPGQVGCVG